jgi:hypothetical protein
MLEQWQCSQHRTRTARWQIYVAHLTVYRGIEQVEMNAFPTAIRNQADDQVMADLVASALVGSWSDQLEPAQVVIIRTIHLVRELVNRDI